MPRLAAWLSLWLLGACGYDVIELSPWQASAGVEVIVVGDVPEATIRRFQTMSGGKSDPKRLAWLSPEDNVALPSNLAPLPFVWKSDKPKKEPQDADVYELRLVSGSRELRVYTTDTSFALDPARWSALLAASSEGSVTCTLRGLANGKARELLDGSTRTLSVRGPLPEGSLYFASSGGIVRAAITESAATPLELTAPSTGEPCLDGLAISADGARLSTTCSAATGGLWTLPVLVALREIPADPARSGAAALDPTGARSAQAQGGELVVLDALSDARLQTVASGRASAPDWSPDGRAIVFVLAEPAAMAMPMPTGAPAPGRDGTSIVRVEQLADGSWGAPLVLVSASADTGSVLRAPRHSPDGAWIAFAAGDERADEVGDVRLFVVPVRGGAPAAVGVVPAAGPMMMGDKRGSGSSPSWLPGDRPDRAWLVFSSTRDVGAQKLAPMLRQLWISAVDLLPQEPGVDLARPAFWLPAQAVTTDNRRASFARSAP